MFSAALDAYGQMALDEAVLNLLPEGAGFLRFYAWTGPAVTFGFGQPLALAEASARMKGLGPVPVVRRPTGGGVVYHDGDLTFSIVFPWARLRGALEVYERLHGCIAQGLSSRGVEVRLAPSGDSSPDVCFQAPSPFDVLAPDGRKLLGGALRRRRGRGLYQGSLRPEFCALDASALREALAEGIRAAWPPGPPVAWLEAIEPAWLEEASRLAAKYRSEAWNARR